MQSFSPVKAISHALNSVTSYRHAALRIGMFWIPVIFVLNALELWFGPPDPQAAELGAAHMIQLISGVVGLLGFSSMAVNWHRFILRDEMGSSARLDAGVFRYAGNSLLIMLIVAMPVLAVMALSMFAPILSVLLLPLGLLLGAAVMRLSIKLPAVALGRKDFTFRDAWAASAGQGWRFVGLLLLNAVIVLAIVVMAMLILHGVSLVSAAAVLAAALAIQAAAGLFLTLLNASIFTSLYGFFVERRSF